MASSNPFDLLDDDAEDPTQLLAAAQKAAAASAPSQAKKASGQSQPPAKTSAKLPSKPLPPAEAVRESRNEGQRGGRGGAYRGRGGRGPNRDFTDNENSFGNNNGFSGGYERPSANGDVSKQPSERRPYNGPRGGGGGRFRGGRGESAEGGERPQRSYDRRSGTGRGNDIKREGGGRANWGTTADDIAPDTEPATEGEKIVDVEKTVYADKQDGVAADANKDSSNEAEEKEKEPEEKEMTLEEYEKVREEQRKKLNALKSEERKVNLDKDLEAMKLLSNKKNNEEFFAKLGSEKEKKKEAAEKVKKSMSINEFLKPADGENYRSGGRGRGRGRGGRGGNVGGNNTYTAPAPAIEDAGQFPSLGGK